MSRLSVDSLDLDYDHLSQDSLYKKIENLKWASALAHIRNNPYESGRWIVKFGGGDTVSSRRLPIHEACVRKPEADIISVLLQIYPNSARECDNHGLLPLHHACVHGAEQDVLCLLAAAYPQAITTTDSWGRNPLDCLLISKNPKKDKYIELLDPNNLSKVSMLASECHEKFSLFKEYNTVASSTIEELSRARNECSSLRINLQAVEENEQHLQKKISALESKIERIIQTYEERESVLINDFESVSKRNTDMKFAFNILEAELAAQKAILAEKEALLDELRVLVDIRIIEQKDNEEIVKLTLENSRLASAIERMTEQMGSWEIDSQRLKSQELQKLTDAFMEEKTALNLEIQKMSESFSEERVSYQNEIKSLQEALDTSSAQKASMADKIELLTEAMKCVIENQTLNPSQSLAAEENDPLDFDSSSFDPRAIVNEASIQRMLLDKALTFAVLKSYQGTA